MRNFFKASLSCRLFIYLLLSFFAIDLFANESPLFIFYNNKPYFPVYKKYTEYDFGGHTNKPVYFKDAPFGYEILKKSFVIYPLIAFGPNTIDLTTPAKSPPSKLHLLGTDEFARDLFVRLLYSIRISVIFALLLTLTGAIIGLVMGLLQTYFKLDFIVGRFIEIWMSFPSFVIVIFLSALFSEGFFILFITLALFNWIPLTNLIRTEFMRAKQMSFIANAEVLGFSTSRIIFRHLIPNAIIAIISYLPFMMNSAIVKLTSLNFLGFGTSSQMPSIGEILIAGKNNIDAPWILISAICVLSFVLVLFIKMGEDLKNHVASNEH